MAGNPGAGSCSSCKRVLRLMDWERGVGLVPVEAAASPPVRTESRGGNGAGGAENLSPKFPAGLLSRLIDQERHMPAL